MEIVLIKKIVLLIIFFSITSLLFARGKTEEEERLTQNDEWILCVTNFDISAIPEDRQAVAGVITREIVERLNAISYRTRISHEYAYYEGYAWAQERSAAARQLAAKQEERAMLIFRGEERWRYRQNLERIDEEIKKLREAFEEADASAPLINKHPEFRLTQGNLDFNYPEPPADGTENQFCRTQMADGFLTGVVIDFHGRFHISLRLYTLYTRSFVFEDSIIFSTEDIESALDELTERLVLALSGGKPATLIVHTQPENSLVLINRSFAGRGEMGAMEYPPGRFVITASASDHETLTVETELSSGDIAEINMSLSPVEYNDIEIPGTSFGGTLYLGSLYVGETPLTLRLPANALEYIELESFDGRVGTAAFLTPNNNPEISFSLPIRTRRPSKPGSVDRARRAYYWGWGGVWVTGIAAWISYQSYLSSDFAMRYNYFTNDSFNQNFADDNRRMYYISMGTTIAVCAVSVYALAQMARYIYVANKSSTSTRKLRAGK